MELVGLLKELLLNTDQYIDAMAQQYGVWVYVIIFLIVFLETGLVVTPFLPGDSLLFAAGTLATRGAMEIEILLVVLIVAAVLGDTVNYHIGKFIGVKIAHKNNRFLKQEYFDRAYRFYEKHGGKTIVLARFIPIIRTYVPFVAGAANMNYVKFLSYNALGGTAWVSLFLLTGYFFGNLPFIRDNFTLVILMIVIISILPPVLSWVKAKLSIGK